MELLLKGAEIFLDGRLEKADMRVSGGIISEIGDHISCGGDGRVIDFSEMTILPGLADVHVHLREPGFSYKETIKTGSLAAAHGGYTAVCAMPNLDPVPDSMENLQKELDIIARDAVIDVFPYGAITCGEKGEALADMDAMANNVVAFSDDGKGVQSEGMMRAAMVKAKALGKLITAHCEDENLLTKGWSVHSGDFAAKHGLTGNLSESEWSEVKRDLLLAGETGCGFHACHISSKESVELIRRAKKAGVDATCETAPHYLALCDDDLRDEGRFRMNPPIRAKADRDALMAGLLDGTVDMIATDHAPHSAEEKSGGLAGSLNGIVGLECAFPVMYTALVRGGVIPLSKLIDLMCLNPRRRFKLGSEDGIEVGKRANFAVFDLKSAYKINSGEFLSMGKATPFDGWRVYGKCLMTVLGDTIAWEEKR